MVWDEHYHQQTMRLFFALLRTLLVVGLLGGLTWVVFGSEWMRLRDVRVVGNSRTSPAQLRHLAGLSVGEPLMLLDLERAVAGVERHPWVAKATIRRALPDTVMIQVEERVPTALLLLDGLYLVDAEGNAFRRATAPDLDLPVLTGLDPELARREPALARRIVEEGLAWLRATPTHGLDTSEVSEVRFDTKSGYTLALRNGGELLLGFQDRSVLDRLPALARQGVDLTRPHRIDLASASLAVVTPL